MVSQMIQIKLMKVVIAFILSKELGSDEASVQLFGHKVCMTFSCCYTNQPVYNELSEFQ